MTRTRRPAPWWFALLVVVSVGVACRLAGIRVTPDGGPALGFWGFLIAAIQWIWNGLQVVADISVQALYYIVVAVRLGLKYAWNAINEVGTALWSGARDTWEFLRTLYEDVLKPGWFKFWEYVDRFKNWLHDVFQPVLEFLAQVRKYLLDFYARWIRPILDSLELARKVLHVFETLGLEWAKKLDQEIARLEEKFDSPFQWALGQLTGIINLVNRVVTANGLFQRLALVRSIERDIKYVYNEFHNGRSTPISAAARQAIADKNLPRTADAIGADLRDALARDPLVLWTDEERAAFDAAVFGPR